MTPSCAIYIDYESLNSFLCRHNIYHIPLENALYSCLTSAHNEYGEVTAVRAYAEWSRFPAAANLLARLKVELSFMDHNQPDAVADIVADARMRYENGLINTIIVLTQNDSYSSVFDNLKSEPYSTVVWCIEISGCPRLASAVDQIVSLDSLIQPDSQSSAIPRHFLMSSLIIVLEDLMISREARHLPLQLCVEHLNSIPMFAPNGEMWLNEAVKEGGLATTMSKTEPPTMICFFAEQHRKVQSALDARDRLLLTLDSALRKYPWLAFGRLERQLRGVYVFGHTEQERKLWINLLIQCDMIRAQLYDNPVKHGYKTTGLWLNLDHPTVKALNDKFSNHVQELVVIVNQFIYDKQYEWIAASTALRFLERSVTSGTAQQILSIAVENDIVLVEKINNLGNETSALRLNYGHSFVQSTLDLQDYLVSLVMEFLHQRQRACSYIVLLNLLRGRHFGHSEDYRRFWLDLLISRKILRKTKSGDIVLFFLTSSNLVRMALERGSTS